MTLDYFDCGFEEYIRNFGVFDPMLCECPKQKPSFKYDLRLKRTLKFWQLRQSDMSGPVQLLHSDAQGRHCLVVSLA